MIRVNCPHCEYAQEFPVEAAGTDAPCEWCGEPLTVGGPAAEFVPENSPERKPLTAGRVLGWLCVTVAMLLGLLAFVGLPILDFGYGVRFGTTRPTAAFWLVLLVGYGFLRVGEQLHGETPPGEKPV